MNLPLHAAGLVVSHSHTPVQRLDVVAGAVALAPIGIDTEPDPSCLALGVVRHGTPDARPECRRVARLQGDALLMAHIAKHDGALGFEPAHRGSCGSVDISGRRHAWIHRQKGILGFLTEMLKLWPDCPIRKGLFLNHDLQGQTHRKVGTQSHRSTGHSPHDGGNAR